MGRKEKSPDMQMKLDDRFLMLPLRAQDAMGGFRQGSCNINLCVAPNVLEPAMGAGNFFGMLPDKMQDSRLYGVELDDITGRIAKQLYPKADVRISGFEKTDFQNVFLMWLSEMYLSVIIRYRTDRAYDKLGFRIHDYFFAKTLDKVRPGGIVAFVTSKGTMDKQSPQVRKYLAQRAELEEGEELTFDTIPANPNVKNYSYCVVDDKVYYRENSIMKPADVSESMEERIKGMIGIRDCTQELITMQMEEYSDAAITAKQQELNDRYDDFSKKFGLISSQTFPSI